MTNDQVLSLKAISDLLTSKGHIPIRIDSETKFPLHVIRPDAKIFMHTNPKNECLNHALWLSVEAQKNYR